MEQRTVDVAVVGGGIVGLATARALLEARPGLDVVVLEKEAALGSHQSGRSSGVLHTGLYYAPGSAKAAMVREGRRELAALCADRSVPLAVLGKVVVAAREDQRPRLVDLATRAAANGVAHELVGPAGLRGVEPYARGVAALVAPEAAVVDYPAVCRLLGAELRAAGAEVRRASRVVGAERSAGVVSLLLEGAPAVRARHVVTCAGLQGDLVARLLHGDAGGVRTVPFRGEFHHLRPQRAHLVRGLVYPLADPGLPFLGVHLTRDLDGGVHVGPNAVLALAREGYRWSDVSASQVARTLTDPALRRLVAAHWRTGLDEVVRSRSRHRFAAAARRLVAGIGPDDLVAAPAGVRAQAVRDDGTLVDDFAFRTGDGCTSVLNAPSPAATACLAIGRHVASLVLAAPGARRGPPRATAEPRLHGVGPGAESAK